MTTFVGTQTKFCDALTELLELDAAAVKAYETAINNLKNSAVREKLQLFKADHERHIAEIGTVLKNRALPFTSTDGVKEVLASGKTYLAQLFGDKAIIAAMITNEDDTNTAYERMHERTDKWPETIEIIERGWQDEIRHRNWLKEKQSHL
jgi:rubrerythrin